MPRQERQIRGARRRQFAAVLVASCLIACPRDSAAAPRAFWDGYLQARAAASRAPDSLLAVAEARLAVDPDDFLAAWMAGRCAPRARDSLAAVARVAREGAPPRAGAWVTRAMLALGRGRRPDARTAFERAAGLYADGGRHADASRALVFDAVQAVTSADSTAFDHVIARAESLARRSNEPGAIADVLLARAVALYDDVPGSARSMREEAVRLLEPLGPSSQLASAHRGLGNVLKFLGELDAAEREFRSALDVATALGEPQLTSQSLGGLGNVQLARADFGGALDSYTRALELARTSAQPRTLMARHGDLATLHLQLGHVRESREHLDAAEQLVPAARAEMADRLALLDTRAALEALAGRFDAARTVLDTAIALATRAGAPSRVPLLRLRQAQIAADLGEPEASERFADQGLAAARAVGHRRAEIALGAHRAELLLASGRTREALAAARELAVACERTEPRQLGAAVRLEAGALARLGRTTEALRRLRHETVRAAAAGDTSNMGRTLSFEAELRMRRGENRAAERGSKRAFQLLRAAGDTAGSVTAALIVGQAVLAAGRPAEAIRWLRPALAHEERVSSRLRSSDDRAGHRAAWYEGAVALAAAHVAAGAPERALAVLEQTRARELWRMIGRRASGMRTHVDAALADAVDRAETELAALQGLRMRAAGTPAGSPRELARLDARIDSVKARHADLMHQVQRAAPLYGAASAAAPTAPPEAMAKLLQADEQVHLFMVGEGRTVLWRMDREGVRARVLPVGEAWWASRVAGLVERLQTGRDRQSAVGGLGDTLFGPWHPTTGIAQLHVVPDGPLHDLPFDALEVLVGNRGRRALIELAEVNEAPSAAMLFAAAPARSLAGGIADVVAFGDPELVSPSPAADGKTRGGAYPPAARLANTRREVEAIREAFPGARVYLGRQATESTFLEEARRSTILHVAAHGFVDDRRPAYSGLALAPDRRDGRPANDGLVQAFEVADASIHAELATLSACESGAGTLRRGEGLQGLARAFQIAGVRHLLVSLWRVEDVETADLMSTFYRRLASGAAPATALRAAKLESLARHRTGAGIARGVGTRARTTSGAAAATWPAFVMLGPRSDR